MAAELDHQLVARYRDRLPLFAALSATILLVAALASLGTLIAGQLRFDVEPTLAATDGWAWAFFTSGVLAALLAWIIPTLDQRTRTPAGYGRLAAVLFALLVYAGWGIFDAGDAVREPERTEGVGFAISCLWLAVCFLLACSVLPWRSLTAGVAFAWAALGPVGRRRVVRARA